MSKIRIENPRAGSAKYTTMNQALRLVAQGDAVLIGEVLHFLSDAERRHQRNIEMQLAREASTPVRISDDSAVDQVGMIYWNGSNPRGQHRPGERRS